MSGPSEETAALLSRLRERGARPYAELGVVRARRAVDAATWMQGEKHQVAEVRDVLVAGGAGRVPARLYHPAPGRRLPLALYLHGGGWVAGGVAVVDRPCRALALAGDCAVLSVEYRLAPETPFPGGLQDCVAAVRWVQANASRLGADPERIALVGDSAGGNLAAATTLVLREEGGPRLTHQLLAYPCLGAPGDDEAYASRTENAHGYQLELQDVHWFYDHYLPCGEGDPAAGNPLVAPLLAPSLADLPPATLVVAELDPLRDEGVAYAGRLKEAGVPSELVCWPGAVHGFFWMAGELAAGRELIAYMGSVLKQAFGRGAQ